MAQQATTLPDKPPRVREGRNPREMSPAFDHNPPRLPNVQNHTCPRNPKTAALRMFDCAFGRMTY
jgi:hypothetical protein